MHVAIGVNKYKTILMISYNSLSPKVAVNKEGFPTEPVHHKTDALASYIYLIGKLTRSRQICNHVHHE